MKSGTRPIRIDHRDRDFHRTFGNVAPLAFPSEYLCDAGLTMPDQELINPMFTNVPALPFGCTDYAQSELANDINGRLHNPMDLENVTHANVSKGADIRASLLAAKNLGWFTNFYNIQPAASLDFFDSFRLAQMVGQPEKRSITLGTPWFPSWEQAATNGVAIMPMPTADEINAVLKNPLSISWHDSKLDGWTQINGITVYRDKSWQGRNIGQGGFVFFTREVINTVMSLGGTVGFTATDIVANAPQTISVTNIQWLISYIRSILNI